MIISLLGGDKEGAQLCYQLNLAEQFVGRLPTCQIQTQSTSVSRMHCRIYKNNAQWMIEDLRSLNGIAINGRRAHLSPIQYGDILQIGKLFFVFTDITVNDIPAQSEWLSGIEQTARKYEQASELFPNNTPAAPAVQTVPAKPPAAAPYMVPKPVQEPDAQKPITRTRASDIIKTPGPTVPDSARRTTQLSYNKTPVQHPTPKVASALPGETGAVKTGGAQPNPLAQRTPDLSQLHVKTGPDWTVWIVIGIILAIVAGIVIWKVTQHAPGVH